MRGFIFISLLVFIFSGCSETIIIHPNLQLDSLRFVDKSFGTNYVLKDIQYDDGGRLVRFGEDIFKYLSNGNHGQTMEHQEGTLGVIHDFLYTTSNQLREIISTPASSSDNSWVRRDRKFHYKEMSNKPSSIERNYLGNSLIGLEQVILTKDISSDLQQLEYDSENIVKETRQLISEVNSVELSYKVTNTLKYNNDENVYKKIFGDTNLLPLYFCKFLYLDDYFIFSKNNVISITTGNRSHYYSYSYDSNNRVSEIVSGNRSVIFYYKN